MLLTRVGTLREGYQGRISASEKHVILKTVTGADEGSYTIRDAEGNIRMKLCLKVRGERKNDDKSHSFNSCELSCSNCPVTASISVLLLFPSELKPSSSKINRLEQANAFFIIRRLCVQNRDVFTARPFCSVCRCLRAPKLWGSAICQTTEDQPDTEQLLGSPLLHPEQWPQRASAPGQGRIYKCKWSFSFLFIFLLSLRKMCCVIKSRHIFLF